VRKGRGKNVGKILEVAVVFNGQRKGRPYFSAVHFPPQAGLTEAIRHPSGRFRNRIFHKVLFYLLPPPRSPCSSLFRLSRRLPIGQDRPLDTRPSSQSPAYAIPTKDNGKEDPNDGSPDVTGLFVCLCPAPPPPCCKRTVVFVLRCFPTWCTLLSYEAHDCNQGYAGDGINPSQLRWP